VATVRLSNHAERALERLYRSDRRLYGRVMEALGGLTSDPHAGKPLHGELARFRSLRVGALRIIYSFESEQLLVLVLEIGQRGSVYRSLE
jgi:mRNA-degrading endonuclease RelE of RelBE toxin-antitoxin system